MPDSNLKQLGEDSLQMAKDLSIATQTITDAVTIYANASESASSILNKAQPTALLSAASGMSASKSADTIQGILNQFDMTDTQAMHVADSIEKLSSEIAVDFSKGISTISDAVSVSGSVMNEAGLSFEKYGAIVSAVTEETRSSGSVLGNAFKTIASRITRSKDGDVNSEDVANAERAYNSLGINIRQSNGEFQDLSVTLDELHKVWGGLNNAQKSYIAEQSAGVRGKNIFVATMDTYSRALELEQSALNSSGTAMKINEVRMDSIDGKMQKLSATMTDIYNDTLSSDAVKGMLDLSQNILDVVDSLGLMKSALASLGVVAVSNGISLLQKHWVSLAAAIKSPTTAIAVGVGVAIAAHQAYIKAFDNAVTSAEKSQDAYSQTTQELESMNSELQTTQDRLSELQALKNAGTLTLTEEKELEKLKVQNTELERQIALTQDLADKQSKQTINDTNKALNYERTRDLTQSDYAITETGEEVATGYKQTDIITATRNELDELIKLKAQKDKLIADGGSEKAISDISNKINLYTDEISKNVADINKLRDNYLDSNGNPFEWLTDTDLSRFNSMTAILDDFSNIDLTPTERQLNKLNKFFDGSKGASFIKQELMDASDSTESLEKALQSMGLTLDDIGVDSIDTLKRYLDEAKSSAEGVAEAMKTLSDTESIGAVTKALETDDAGANYEKAVSSAEKIRELLDQGLVGKDEFKAFSDYLSYGMDDSYEAYQNGIDKFNRYFTTDSSSGVQNFINDLVAKSDELGTSWAKVNEAGDGWVFNVDNTAKAAKEMGISVGMIEDIFGRLQDYGFEIDWHSALSDLNTYSDALSGIKDIYDDMGDTVSKDRLGKLLGNWDEEFLGFQQDLSTLTDEQIVKIKFEYDKASLQLTIDEVKNDIEGGDKSVENYAQYYSANKQYIDISKSTLGLDKEGIQLPVQITGAETELNQLISMMRATNDPDRKVELQAEITNKQELIKSMLNDFSDQHPEITPDTDVDTVNNALADYFSKPQHLYVDAELKSEDVKEQLAQMSEGSTITFNAEINGVIEQVEAIKNEDGTITYSTVINGEPTEITLNKDGTITYQVNEVPGTKVETPEGPYERVVNEVPGEQVETVDDATGVANFGLGESPKEVPAAAGLANFILGSYPTSLPPIYQTVYQNVVRQRATGSMFAPAHATGTTGYNVVNTISGSAYVNGQVSLPYDERALVNELGRESFIRDGKWMLLPPGMHLQDFKKGDIILSASQTEALMKYGRASGKGNAYANGTIPPSVLTHAYSGGMTGGGSFKGGASSYNPSGGGSSGYSSNNNNNNNNNSPVSNEEAKDTADTLDWIETLLKRIQDAIESLGKKASSVFKTWKNRNSALVEQMKKVNEELALQEQAYNRYLAETEPIGLSDHYKELVRNGAIDIELVSDETLKENIQNFQTWYEKALECEKALEDLKETAAELNKTKFDNVVSEFEQLLNKFNYQKNMMDEYMNQMAAHGYQTSTRYYQSKLIAESNSNKELVKQRNAMLVEFESAMLSGTIEKGSEAWYDMANQIDEVTVAIEESHTAILEYKKEIRDIEWGYFDLLQERITQITNEAEFLIDLMGNKKLYDDKGQLTDEGMATMGLYGQNYNVYMEQSKRYAEEIKRIDKELADDPYNQDLINRRNELLEQQREMILSAEQQKDAIVNLVKEGIELELESLKKLIDETNEALNSQKDLYDYQNRVRSQTRSLLELQKALSAYQGDDSEEAKVIKQQLQVNIEKAQQELQETEYDKYISDVTKLTSSLYDEYELILNSRLDNIDALVADMITEINSNASSINSTLEEQASSVGITLSSEMQDIWGGTDGIKTVLTFYGADIANSIVDAGTTINSTLGTINTNLSNMIEQLNKIAGTNIKAAATSEAEVSKEANAQKPQPKPEPTPEPEPESKADFFIYRKSEYPKDQLNKDTSIVDRLAYHDYDWSFDARKLYYNKMGFSGEYVSSAEQNIGMLNWMKLNGYKKGLKHADKDEWAWTQEDGKPEVIIRPSDGSILTPVKYDDAILNSIATENIFEFANNPGKFIDNLGKSLDSTPNILNSVANNNNAMNGDIIINMTNNLPNVKNAKEFEEQFFDLLQNSHRAEKIIHAMTVDRFHNKSRLQKYRY